MPVYDDGWELFPVDDKQEISIDLPRHIEVFPLYRHVCHARAGKQREQHTLTLTYMLVLAVEVSHSPARPMMSRPEDNWLKKRG